MKQMFWEGLEKVAMKIANRRARLARSYLKAKDDGLGRERVGTDRFGNNYYQYYSYHGLPTRRIVLYKFFENNKFHQDPHFLSWQRRQDILPPTPEALEKAYLEHDAF
jgi:NADH:ubiquinone oxidoreductase subunit